MRISTNAGGGEGPHNGIRFIEPDGQEDGRMDADRFDDTLRHFAAARRPVLALGLGALLTAAGVTPGEAKKKRRKHKKKPGGNTAGCAGDTDCGTGLRCNGGQCLCDAQSNPGGCCSADRRTAFPGIADDACGVDGNICQACQANFFCIGGGVCI